jgi:uncharacterized membrane protein
MSHPPPRQMLTLQIASAIGWAVLAQWPWSPWAFHVLLAQAVLHVVAPFWFHSIVRIRPVHLACLVGPIALAVIDAAFLVFAWKADLWRDLTTVFVPLLGGAGIIALSYATSVMIVLDRRRARRERLN